MLLEPELPRGRWIQGKHSWDLSRHPSCASAPLLLLLPNVYICSWSLSEPGSSRKCAPLF